jgi:hypothetical protein
VFTLSIHHTACPFLHTIHFPASGFSWSETTPTTDPPPSLDSFTMPSRPHKTRYRCKTCGACVASYNTLTDRWSVWGAQLRRDEEGRIERWEIVRPTAHIFYGTRMLDVGDDLGKWMGYEGKSERFVR